MDVQEGIIEDVKKDIPKEDSDDEIVDKQGLKSNSGVKPITKTLNKEVVDKAAERASNQAVEEAMNRIP
jgi:hypothetical protein